MSVKFTRRAGFGICAAVAIAAMSPVPVEAQTALCGKRTAIVDALKTKYNETRQAMGIVGTDSVVELYISEAGTWTMLVTSASGLTCVMAAGHSWDGTPTLASGAPA
jgi:hypothetical protein